ncbi:MAG: hypothetical protein WC450_10930, partial [Candidatus Omnitrophota bacterium]
GIRKLLKKVIIPEVRDRFVRGETGYRIDILSFGAVRDLERPSLPEAHRAVIAFLEDQRLYPEKWHGAQLTPGNFRVIAVDRGETTLKEAMEGVYNKRIFKELKKFRFKIGSDAAVKELMERYFDDLGKGSYQVKEAVRQFIEPRPAVLTDFQPVPGEKFDLILYNYIEYLIEMQEKKEKKSTLIGTNEIANNMLRWFKEGGMLLTTAMKWFKDFPQLNNVEMSRSYFFEKEVKTVALYLWQYFSVAYTKENFDEQFEHLIDGLKKRLLKMGFDIRLNDRLVHFAWQKAKEVHLPQQRERGWPFLVHPLGALNILLSKDLVIRYLVTKTKLPLDVYIAGILLHDIIEDAPMERADMQRILYEGFVQAAGEETARQLISLILMVTKDKGQDDESYLKRIFESTDAISLAAQIIKVPDRIDNFSNPPPGKPAEEQEKKVSMTTRYIEDSQLPLVMKMLYLKLRDMAYISEMEKLGIEDITQPVFIDHIIPWFDFIRDEQGRFIGIHLAFKDSNEEKIAIDRESFEKSFHLVDMDYRNIWRNISGTFIWEKADETDEGDQGNAAVSFLVHPDEIVHLDKVGIYLWLSIRKGVSDKIETVSFGEKNLIRSMAILKPNSSGRQIVGFSTDEMLLLELYHIASVQEPHYTMAMETLKRTIQSRRDIRKILELMARKGPLRSEAIYPALVRMFKDSVLSQRISETDILEEARHLYDQQAQRRNGTLPDPESIRRANEKNIRQTEFILHFLAEYDTTNAMAQLLSIYLGLLFPAESPDVKLQEPDPDDHSAKNIKRMLEEALILAGRKLAENPVLKRQDAAPDKYFSDVIKKILEEFIVLAELKWLERVSGRFYRFPGTKFSRTGLKRIYSDMEGYPFPLRIHSDALAQRALKFADDYLKGAYPTVYAEAQRIKQKRKLSIKIIEKNGIALIPYSVDWNNLTYREKKKQAKIRTDMGISRGNQFYPLSPYYVFQDASRIQLPGDGDKYRIQWTFFLREDPAAESAEKIALSLFDKNIKTGEIQWEISRKGRAAVITNVTVAGEYRMEAKGYSLRGLLLGMALQNIVSEGVSLSNVSIDPSMETSHPEIGGVVVFSRFGFIPEKATIVEILKTVENRRKITLQWGGLFKAERYWRITNKKERYPVQIFLKDPSNWSIRDPKVYEYFLRNRKKLAQIIREDKVFIGGRYVLDRKNIPALRAYIENLPALPRPNDDYARKQ